MSSHETLGLLLVRKGAITRPQLYDALRLQRQNGRLLGSCLLELGYVQPQSLLEILSRQLAIPALPPGTVAHAAPEAIRRVPGELAVRLRLIPYSWDGEMLGVAVADGRSLNHLSEVAYHSQSAVGAYVALESEIEATLRTLYPAALGDLEAAPPDEAPVLHGRPRPARAGPADEVPNRDFGAALGLDDDAPVVLDRPKAPVPAREGPPIEGPPIEGPPIEGAPPRAPPPIEGPPPAALQPAAAALDAQPSMPPPDGTPLPAPTPLGTPLPAPTPLGTPLPAPTPLGTPLPAPTPPVTATSAAVPGGAPVGPPEALDRVSFYDAVERVYEVETVEAVGSSVGRALLNYFTRILVLRVRGADLVPIGSAGHATTPGPVRLDDLQQVAAGLSVRNIAYGTAASDARSAELWNAFGLEGAATSLMAPISAAGAVQLLVCADNGAAPDLYDDLHDVELLLKEAETALGLLLG